HLRRRIQRRESAHPAVGADGPARMAGLVRCRHGVLHGSRSNPALRIPPSMSTPKLSTPEMIVRTIQKMIQRGKFKPGQRLPGQRELAEHLNVSRASLREALSTLEALDLVRTSAGRGTYIHDREQSQSEPILDWRFSSQYALQEVYEFRYFTETAAARLAAL